MQNDAPPDDISPLSGGAIFSGITGLLDFGTVLARLQLNCQMAISLRRKEIEATASCDIPIVSKSHLSSLR